MFRDAIHDIYLTAYGYLPIWKHFDILKKVQEDDKAYRVFENLYEEIKLFQLPEEYIWADFMPEGNPATHWNLWKAEAIEFFDDTELYLDDRIDFMPRQSWANAHRYTGPQFSALMKNFVIDMEICNLYDGVWPRVAFNYRMLSLNAFVDPEMRDFVLDHQENYSVLPPLSWLDE